MSFDQYIAVPAVVELHSGDKVEAFRELAAAVCKALDIKKAKKVIGDEMLRREEAASTFIGQGLALPQARGPIAEEFAVVIGRSMRGIEYNAARGALAHVIVLLVSREDADNMRQVQLLAEIADFFKADAVREMILSPDAPPDIRTALKELKKGQPETAGVVRAKRRVVLPIIRTALTLAREIKATAIMVFADAVRDNEFLDQIKSKVKPIVVTSSRTRFDTVKNRRVRGFLQTPSIPASRTGQIKIGILLALSRGLIRREDLVVCISGNPNNGSFDTIVAINVEKEYDFFFAAASNIVPPDVKPEVLERVIALAGEIAVEGREGKSIGTIFVLGDTNSVNVHVRQLIINPFRGYSEAERNILDPSLAETIKEFASIDGAFIVTGDGIVLSAGSYLRPLPIDERQQIQSGLGARHFAAAGITACSNALAITVSESTGMVTLFKNGVAMMTLEQPVVHDRNQVHRFLQ
ncbi:MAG: diadenylate cyclase [Chitinispirillaceae bacterium]|jgi:DNA integrity scanning protein DisA with diadenylate cyclase activity/mannitol/fructose-specific phosphotransferase system IIA component (Ntr-type)|nr:diadenylate cyclase [Chitinispirillaceae bacterium]